MPGGPPAAADRAAGNRPVRRGRRAGLTLLACILAVPASAAMERFVYAGDAAFPPHEYLDENGQPAGFNVDLIRLLARESGREVEVRLGVWSDQIRALDAGEVDVMSLGYSDARADRYAWLVQIWTLRQSLLFRAGRTRYPGAFDELSGEVVAVERSGSVHERLLALPPELRPRLRPVDSHREACLLLRNGEVTAAIGAQLSLRYFANRVGLEDTVEVVADSFGYHLATTPDKAARFAFLARTYDRLEGTDAINRLTERAFALSGPEQGLRWRELLPWGGGVAVLLGLVVVWNRALQSQVERRTRELRESERERRNAERLAVLGHVVGAVAHEVRNPLFAISAHLELLESESPDTGNRRLASLRQSVDRLSELMEDLLDYGKSQTMNLERLEALEPVIDEALATAGAVAESRGVRVEAHVERGLPPLDVDRPRLTRALRNLVENAVQFSPRDGVVELRALSPAPGRVEIRVEDPGPGFSPEALQHGFEPFYSMRKGGTGLGLAIVERIATGHGGEVGACNREAGGAAVWIRLPVRREDAEAAGAPGPPHPAQPSGP